MVANFDYESIAPGYYDELLSKDSSPQAAWHRSKFEAVMTHMIKASCVVDLGCGPGSFLGRYCTSERKIGIDLSSTQIEYARKTFGASSGCEFLCGDITQFSDLLSQADYITSLELIEHLDDNAIEAVLRTAFLAMKNGAELIVTTPNYRSFWPLLEIAVNIVGPVDYSHQHISKFSSRRLEQLLLEIGFQEVDVVSFQGITPLVGHLGPLPLKAAKLIDSWLSRKNLGFLLLARAVKTS